MGLVSQLGRGALLHPFSLTPGERITPGTDYESWPQIGYDTVAERLWVTYSDGEQHEQGGDRTTSVVSSDDLGGAWSAPAVAIGDTGVEWRSPSLGYDLDGALLIWSANQTTDNAHRLVRLQPGGTTWDVLSEPAFSPWPTQIGGPVPVGDRLVCIGNRAADGLVIAFESDDNGPTWTQETIFTQGGGAHLVEWRGVALGGGRALFLGRGNNDVGVWQITYDNGVWSTAALTNIDDAYDQPVDLVLDENGDLRVYYDNRLDGIIRRRVTSLASVWSNPLGYGSPVKVARGIINLQNVGYVGVTRVGNVDHVVWYSGNNNDCHIRYAPIA